MFKLTLAGRYKTFVGAKLELESLDHGIFGMSHGVQRLKHCARWRDLMMKLLLFISIIDGQSNYPRVFAQTCRR
jgi:hypothetical protein